MDKQLLNALDNLSDALVLIAEALNKKGDSNTATTNVLQSGDFSKQIEAINTGIKSIKSDTKKILDNQKTILELSKSNNKSAVEEVGGDKKAESNIKKGVGTILLIAVAVLAIGLAFKLVGDVDFVSVIGLSIAIVLISIAFEKVAKLDIPMDKAINAGKVMVIMALAIAVSSWALHLIIPISFTQALTAILIAGMFSVVAYGLNKILKATSEIKNLKDVLLLPLVMLAMSIAITVSSWVLQGIMPISFTQALTAILIAAMFTVLAFGLNKIISATEKIKNIASVILLPIIMLAMSIAITMSSWVLQGIMPVSFTQAITAILISAMFVVLSFGIERIVKGISSLDWKDIAKLPTFFFLMSVAIALSSGVFSAAEASGAFTISATGLFKAIIIGLAMSVIVLIASFVIKTISKIDYADLLKLTLVFTLLSLAITVSAMIFSNMAGYFEGISFEMMFKMMAFSVSLAISIAVVAIAMWVVNKLGNVDTYLEGGISLVIIASAIWASSHILSAGDYSKYPGWEWSLSVGLSLLVFGLAAVALGMVISSGIGAVALAAGVIGVLAVAGTIVASSHILSKGNYSKYPDLDWSKGVGLSLLTFGTSMVLLGSFITATLGVGAIAIAAGGEAVLMVAKSIVDVSHVLKKGDYSGGPTKAWAQGISIALGAFMPIYKMLMNQGVLGLLTGGPSPKEFANSILIISNGIITAAGEFSKHKGEFKNGPSKAWAEGVGLAIGAFAPVYTALMNSSLWDSKVTPEQMSAGITTIVGGVVIAATEFAKNKAVFDPKLAPSKQWSANVAAALGAFSPIIKMMNDQMGFLTSGDEVAQSIYNGISWTSMAIVKVANTFRKVTEWVSPPKTWVNNVKSTISGFIGIINDIKDLNWVEKGLVSDIARRMVSTASIFHRNARVFSLDIDPNYMKNLSSNVLGFANLAKKLTEANKGGGTLKSLFGQDPMSQTANSMVKLATAYDKLASALKNFGGALQSIDGDKVNLIRRLTGNLAVLAAMNEQAFSNMMSTLESKSSVFSKLLDSGSNNTSPTVGITKTKGAAGTISTEKPSKYGTTSQQLDILIELMLRVNHSTSSVDEYIASKHFSDQDKPIDLGMK